MNKEQYNQMYWRRYDKSWLTEKREPKGEYSKEALINTFGQRGKERDWRVLKAVSVTQVAETPWRYVEAMNRWKLLSGGTWPEQTPFGRNPTDEEARFLVAKRAYENDFNEENHKVWLEDVRNKQLRLLKELKAFDFDFGDWVVICEDAWELECMGTLSYVELSSQENIERGREIGELAHALSVEIEESRPLKRSEVHLPHGSQVVYLRTLLHPHNWFAKAFMRAAKVRQAQLKVGQLNLSQKVDLALKKFKALPKDEQIRRIHESLDYIDTLEPDPERPIFVWGAKQVLEELEAERQSLLKGDAEK